MIPGQDPKAMMQGAGEEPSLRRRYDRQPEPPAAPPIQFNMQPSGLEEEDYVLQNPEYPQNPQGYQQQEPVPPLDEEDDEIFPGGPTESEVLSWKKQFDNRVYMMEANEDIFIFRSLSRYEYKQIVSIKNLDPLMREEIICETCVLWPAGINWQSIADMPAGTAAVVSEFILDKSGFTKNIRITAL